MKKLALLLAVLMIMSAMLVACSKKNQVDEEDETKDPAIVDETDSVIGTDETGTIGEGEETGTTGEGVVENPTTFTFKDCAESSVFTIGSVNIRKEASFASDVSKKAVADATELVKIAESNESAIDSEGNEYKWFKVKYEDAEWYVKSTLVTSMSNPDDGFTPVEKTLYLNTKSLTIRLYPNTENPAVGYLYKGNTVKVIAENAELGWYKISFEGSTYTPAGEYYIVSDAKYFSESPVEVEAEG